MNFTVFLNLKAIEQSSDGVTVECPLQSFHFNPDGSLHGGMIASIADEAVWFAIEHVTGSKFRSTTIELKVNYLRPVANSAVVHARAKVVKAGKTLCVGTVELCDERGTLCAISTVTYMLLGGKTEAA
ncbi:MAG: PaaI family thioesterase [Bryobacterales bacterium]|nr:PaaI family thioesterase [Bryobacterales bacterium]MCZ2151597.1 PaaI family thioesterase [Bryobacterales bacterium]